MPFCPNCKAEYQEGYTVCSDCKVELVDDIKEAEVLIPFFQAEDKKIAEKLVKFFNYSDLNSTMNYDEENSLYIVSIPPKRQMEAKKLYQAFYFVERERIENGESDLFEEEPAIEDDSSEDSDQESTNASDEADLIKSENEAFENLSLEPEETSAEQEEYKDETPSDEINAFDEEDISAPYIMKADQYKDLAGTVWIFLFFGIAGLIVVILNVVGVLSFFNSWITNSVMGAVFLFFIYVALSTDKKAKKIQAEIDEENKLTEKINEWLTKNVTVEFLASIHDESISEELNYIRKTDTIKELLIKEFGNQNLAYLDRLIEEHLDTLDGIE